MLTVVKSLQEEKLELGDCQEADMEGGRAAGIAGAWEVCVCARESRKSSTADQSGESSGPCSGCSGHTFSRGAAQLTPVCVCPHLNLAWEEVLIQTCQQEGDTSVAAVLCHALLPVQGLNPDLGVGLNTLLPLPFFNT